MLIRRANWRVILAVAILGPLFGAFVTAKLFGWDVCPSEQAKESHSASAKDVPDKDKPLVLPDGDRVALDELAPGRATAIVVMKAPSCPVCQRQLRALSARLDDVQEANGAVFGLTTAAAERNRKLTGLLGIGFPILGDPSKEVHKSFNMWMADDCHAMPGVIFLDEDGKVTDVHRGRYPGQPQGGYILERLGEISR